MRCRMRRAALVACVAALATGCGSSWSERTSEYGRFRVEMPAPASELAGRIPTPQRELTGEGYGATAYRRPQWLFGRDGPAPLDSEYYSVLCADVSDVETGARRRLAAEIVSLSRQERQQKGARDKLVSESTINVAGCSGVESEIKTRFSHIRERVCVTASRVCVLTALASASKVRGAEANRFFESFESW